MEVPRASTSKAEDIIDQVVALSEEVDTEGFDTQAGKTWIYPTNYTLRDYQYNIIQEVLLKNTMVSLPTGLGKTFIAAVVMYNYYRWYPKGKIIFMAPTRPLVKQQIEACYNIMAIPKEITAELTGTKGQTSRKDIWIQKRVFFVTPQVLQNDLNIVTELGTKIKCLVFDEAHKAKGNHAYCEVIRRLYPKNKYFRVLGLSATPGSTLNDVLDVIHNLLISHLEVRTDESPDVSPYIFQRSLESVVVQLDGKLQHVRDNYIKILEKYTRVLLEHKVISGNCSMLTKGKIFMTMKDYQERSKNGRDRAYSEIMRSLNICITLYHGYELLIRHGLRGFLSFFEEHAEKPLLRGNSELQSIMQDVREYLGPTPNVEPLPDGSIMEIPKSSKFGHPKFYKLHDILSEHFSNTDNENTRVIVFCEYRESVMEAYALLIQHRPLIRPRIFLGQGAITQKQQINVVKAFRDGECNTLISTCIGEEGLDVGEVDLIICFDINNKSPIRMVQRMGRTGRKRQGRVVVLVTEGKEQQTLKDCLIQKQNLSSHILQSRALYKEMYPENPRMIPADIEPKCHKMFITIKAESKTLNKKRSGGLKNFLNSMPGKKLQLDLDCEYDTSVPLPEDKIPVEQEYWNKANPLSIMTDPPKLDFSKKVGKLRSLQATGKIGHSRDSAMLVSLLQFVDSKKYNIPALQGPILHTQMDQLSKLKQQPSSNGFKQMDIRNMFVKPQSDAASNEINTKVTETTDHTKDNIDELLSKIDTYLKINNDDCEECETFFDLSNTKISNDDFVITPWNELQVSILDVLTTDNLTNYVESLQSSPVKLNEKTVTPQTPETVIENEVYDEIDVDHKNDDRSRFEFIDRSFFDDTTFKLAHSPFKPPNSIGKVLSKCGISVNLDDSDFNNIKFTQLENKIEKPKDHTQILNIPDFESSEFTQLKIKPIAKEAFQDTLTFFNMTTLEDIFSDSFNVKTPATKSPAEWNQLQLTPTGKDSPSSQDTIIYSPIEILDPIKLNDENEGQQKNEDDSPVLCSYEKSRQLKHKAQKRLFDLTQRSNQSINCSAEQPQKESHNSSEEDLFADESPLKNVQQQSRPNLQRLLTKTDEVKSSFYKSGEKISDSLLAIPKSDDRNEDNHKHFENTRVNNLETVSITEFTAKHDNKFENTKEQPKEVDISDIIDLSIFGLDLNSVSNIKQPINIQKAGKNVTEVAQKYVSETPKQVVQISLQSKTSCTDKNSHVQTNTTKNMHTSLKNVFDDFCDGSLLDLFLDDPFDVDENISKRTHSNNDASNSKKTQSNNEEKTTSNSENMATLQQQNNLINAVVNKRTESKASNLDKHNDNTSKNDLKQLSAVIDLTHDSPSKNYSPDTSPSLTMLESCTLLTTKISQLQQNFTADQNRKLNDNFNSNQPKTNFEYPNKSAATQILKKSKPKLNLKQKANTNPITSMEWFKKNVQPSTNCNRKPSTADKSVIDNIDSESDVDDCFNFTFNKKLSTKNHARETSCSKTVRAPSPAKSEKANNKQNVVSKAPILSTDDSDDDFETTRNGWIKPINKMQSKAPLSVNPSKRSAAAAPEAKKPSKRKAEVCEFIDSEAEVSTDERENSNSEDDDTDLDKFEESFVDDKTHSIMNTTMVQARYMQSVRSPILNRGKFKIPERPRQNILNVYSQLDVTTDNTYINDSFCVNTEDIEPSPPAAEMSELEIAELVLEQERRNKKKKLKKSKNMPKAKRRRIFQISSDSD